MQKFINLIYKHRYNIFFSLILVLLLAFSMVVFPKEGTKHIISLLENKSFDIRQNVISQQKKTRDDIVILTIDDPSYEFLLEKYGDWPIPRSTYAELLDYIQSQNPKFVAFDFLFIKSLNRIKGSDEKLVEAFKKYQNTYTAINFDNYSEDLRIPPVLNDGLKNDINILSSNLTPHIYSNARQILPELLNVTNNIGHINTPRSDDGFIRKIPTFIKYNNDNYLYMTLKLAIDYLKKYENVNIDEIKIDEDNNLILGSRKIPLTDNGDVILNWYGESGSFKYVSFWEVIKSMSGEKNLIANDTFKDKVVYVGTSVFSLSDIKTVPTSKYIPGVEIHATFLNNIIDNNLIKEVSKPINITICIIFSLLVAITVFKIRNVIACIILYASEIAIFTYLSTFVMAKYYLWTWIILPLLISLFTFICAFIIRYLIKSRDFEQTYKLATTDGLTELYNHRYFQEELQKKINEGRKNNEEFSLIILDIDYFKKFNDKYGHQAGDAVLKHVAKTLKSNVRGNDIVCRYGGEEMTIILQNANKEIAKMVAQKICSTVASTKYELSQDLEVNITISIGVSTFPEDGKTSTELINYADKYLYKAKENGRNQVGNL